MRTAGLILLFLLIAGSSMPQGADAVPRTVLLETYTSSTCPPCASANPVTHQFMLDYGTALVLNVQFHMSWPAPGNDPMYLSNTGDNNIRRSFYGVNSIPDLFYDGYANISPGDYGSMAGSIGSRLLQESPLEIQVNTTVVGDQITVSADITAVDDVPASGLLSYVVLVEPEKIYPSPPGTNGETAFYHVMRDILGSASGTPLSISNGQMVNVTQVGTLDPSWVDTYALVWVQHASTREVFQAASSLPTPNAFYFGASSSAAMLSMGELASFEGSVTNHGSTGDVYDFVIEKTMPAEWSASVCAGKTCYSPWVTDFSVALSPGQSEIILVDVAPYGQIDQGTLKLTATSRNDPSLSWSQEYKVISEGVPILCVDDDGGNDYEKYYHDALDDGGYVYGTWNLDTTGKLAAADLGRFRTVVWNVGLGYPTLDTQDRAALTSFLDGGGHLFVTGQDIGWDIFDPNGYSYSAAAQTWYRTYLGATYLNDDTNDLGITGVPGDPIGDGLSFIINGGSGASNQAYPSEIDPASGGQACLLYSANREAGVRKDGGNWKSVYFAFGFEGIGLVADRALIMQRVMDWFGSGATDVPEDRPARPVFATEPTAVPNPFNPSTELRFMVAGSGTSALEIDIYDLRGRRVRALFHGEVEPGSQSFPWDGLSDDGHGVASGVYMAKVKLGADTRNLKMSLTK